MILVGNSETFSISRKGQKVWQKLLDLLAHEGTIFDGLPVTCPQHPERKAVLSMPEDFEKHCPDGGCSEPW